MYGIRFFKGLVILVLIQSNSGFVSAQSAEASPQDSTKNIKLAGIPVVNYNRSVGLILGAMGSVYYKLNKTDTISPSSSSMLLGIWTTNHSSMVMGMQQFYFDEDRWRVKLMGGSGDIFFQYFQEVPNLPPAFGQYDFDGKWINFNTNAQFFVVDVRRRVFPDFYAGILGIAQWTKTGFDIQNPITGSDVERDANMISLGFSLLYDNRNDVNFPEKGFYVELKTGFDRKAFGSTSNFEEYRFAANYFWDIHENGKTILVPRFFMDLSIGDVPFQGENFIGCDDLRGYSQGRFRGNQVYAIQAELRQNLYKGFGVIGFLGFGTAIDRLSDLSNAPFLPSIGGGLRYMMIPSEKIRIGIDAGVGKDDWSLTFRIGESFGR